jgi:hypothetical protein
MTVTQLHKKSDRPSQEAAEAPTAKELFLDWLSFQPKSVVTFFEDVNAGVTLTGTAVGAARALNNAIGESVAHLSDDDLYALAAKGVAETNVANALSGVGVPLTVYLDFRSGKSIAYTTGDAVGGLGGALIVGGQASVDCGGPEEPAGIICGVVGSILGGFFGSDVLSHALGWAF